MFASIVADSNILNIANSKMHMAGQAKFNVTDFTVFVACYSKPSTFARATIIGVSCMQLYVMMLCTQATIMLCRQPMHIK